MRKILFNILFVSGLPISAMLYSSHRDLLITTHGLLAELLIVTLLTQQYFAQKKFNDAKYSLLLYGFISFFCAEILYDSKILLGISLPVFLDNLSEILYTLSLAGIFIFLISLKSNPANKKQTTFIFLSLFALYFSLNFFYILNPFYIRTPSPTIFNLINSTIYSLLSAATFAISIPKALLTKSMPLFLFLQGIILLLISQFALQYQVALIDPSSFVWADLGWNMSVAIIGVAIMGCHKKALFDLGNEKDEATYFSIRCLLTLCICVINIFFLGGILLANMTMINDAFHLTNLLLLVFVVWCASNFFSLIIAKDFSQIIEKMSLRFSKNAESLSLEKIDVINGKSLLDESNIFIKKHNELVQEANNLIDQLVTSRQALHVSNIAQQVAHDIRSPLAALDMVMKDLDSLPEQTRLIVRHSLSRIHDITNNLSSKNILLHHTQEIETTLLSNAIASLISEKRIQYRSKLGIQISFELSKESYGLFSQINVTEFKRLLSNLINNSVEAMNDTGIITLKLRPLDEKIELEISDNGKGISPELLARLGKKGVTYGKTGGSGLGLYHAKATMESWGGELHIASTLGQGTTITLAFKRTAAPSWFVENLILRPHSRIVVIDDDSSIHHVWKGRFDSALISAQGIELIHLSDPLLAKSWWAEFKDKAPTLFLVDYEFLGSNLTGLDLIQDLQIEKEALLVTSRYEEKEIQEKAKSLKLSLIPKTLVTFIPINVMDGAKTILVDDDLLIRLTWEKRAKEKNINLKTHESSKSFLAELENLHPETTIYLDSKLEDGVKGEDIAKICYERGFKNLYLATGYENFKLEDFPWIKGIIGKVAPF